MARGWSRRVVHDLRNPLSPLRTAAYLLRHGRVEPEEQRQLLEVIDRQSARLLALLDELADGLHADQGEMAARYELVDLCTLAVDASMPLAPLACDGPLPVRGDPVRLTQLLRTLRALRLHDDGSDNAAVSPLRAVADDERVVLRRELPAQAPLREDPAGLLDAPLPPALSDGLGLQLPIAAGIARAHGGLLRLERVADDETLLMLTVELPRAALGGEE